MPATVLVAVDLSEANRPAFEAGVRIAKDLQARVVLLHVVHPFPDTIRNHPEAKEHVKEVEAELTEEAARDLTEEWAEEARKQGVDVEPVIVGGDARDVILEEAKKRDVRLVVMGSHGRSGLARLMGSVSRSVVRGIDRPVLVVPSRSD